MTDQPEPRPDAVPEPRPSESEPEGHPSTSVPDLGNLRHRLDTADRRLLEALADRQRLVRETARVKAGAADFVRDPEREESLLEARRETAREMGLDSFFVARLYRQILDHSVRFQTDHLVGHHGPQRAERALTIAYQGTEGAYSHIAAQHHFDGRGPGVAYRGSETFRQALEAVEEEAADYALLPIENTTAGSINEVYDLLAEKRLWLVGEEVLKVEHCLVALEKVPLTHVRRVASHPQALAQCSRFLARLAHCRVESYADTAMAARRLLEERDLSAAAIASEEAARLYGLRVLARDVADQEGNYTRFVTVAREPVRPDLRIPCKTSLAFVTLHEQGALVRCLRVLADHGLNLTKLESRPVLGSPWKYQFYADFEGNAADPKVDRALSELERVTRRMRVLGSYPVSVVAGEG